MFENFAFEKRDRLVTGYHFPVENAAYVMCLIHGIGEHAGRYQRMADRLASRNIAVVSMDLRGHGISSGIRGDTAPRKEILKDIDSLIEYAKEFYPQAPLTLYGHSMGGNLCLDYRCRGGHNDVPAKYIVSAPWIKLVMEIPKPLYLFARGASKIVPKVTIDQNLPEEDLGNPEFVRPYKKDPLVHTKISLRCAVQCVDFGDKFYEEKSENNHRAEGKPLLLMHGDMDKICDVNGSRHVARRFAEEENFTYIEWPGYCHEIHNGGPGITGDKVIEAIGDFIVE